MAKKESKLGKNPLKDFSPKPGLTTNKSIKTPKATSRKGATTGRKK